MTKVRPDIYAYWNITIKLYVFPNEQPQQLQQLREEQTTPPLVVVVMADPSGPTLFHSHPLMFEIRGSVKQKELFVNSSVSAPGLNEPNGGARIS